MVKAQKNIEDYNEDDYKEDNPDFDLPLLSEKLGENIEIRGIRFDEASRGLYAVVTTETGAYRTSSEVLIDKLKKMHDKVESGVVIRVNMGKETTKVGTYHVFKAPV